jgi:putative transposase
LKTVVPEWVNLSRSAYYRVPQDRDDRDVIDALNELVEQHPRWGFWLYFDSLKLEAGS